MLWVAQEIRFSGQVQSLCIVTTENRSDLIQNIWTVKRLSQSDIYKLYVFIWGWFFHSLDGVGDRIRTKVHVDIIGKFCTAEVRPKNVLHFNASYSPPPPHTLLPSFRASYGVIVCYNQSCGSNMSSHKVLKVSGKLKPIPFRNWYNGKSTPWGFLSYTPFYIKCTGVISCHNSD